jgi:predicted Zn-dependent protease
VSKRDAEIKELLRLAALSPDESRHLLKLGDLLTKENRLREAADYYDRAATIYVEKGFPLKAVAVWSTVVKLDPSRTAVRIHLARGYVQLDLRDDAIAELQRAIADYRKKDDEVGERVARAELDRIVRPS